MRLAPYGGGGERWSSAGYDGTAFPAEYMLGSAVPTNSAALSDPVVLERIKSRSR